MTSRLTSAHKAELKKLVALGEKGRDAVALIERAGYLEIPYAEAIVALGPFYVPPSGTALERLEKLQGKKAARKLANARMTKAHERGANARVDRDLPLSEVQREAALTVRADEKLFEMEAGERAKALHAEKVGNTEDQTTYVDVAALGDEVEPPRATAGMMRDDGVYTLVSYEWSGLNGRPGDFKSGLAALHAVETLNRGGRVFWCDVDGNTAQSVVSRLVAAGTPLDMLRDLARFRLMLSSSPKTLLESVEDSREWLRLNDLVVVDAAGGLVAAFGGNSNDADDWMRIYQQMLAPLVVTGAAGLLIDHHAKTAASTDNATGTGAKKKSQHGIVYNVTPFKDEPPRPNSVGKVSLSLVKDTHGATGYGIGECVAVLEIDSRDAAHGPWSWRLMPGRPRDQREGEQAGADVEFVLSLNPFPSSRSALQAAIKASQGKGWRAERASTALAAARDRRDAAAVTFNPATFERNEKD